MVGGRKEAKLQGGIVLTWRRGGRLVVDTPDLERQMRKAGVDLTQVEVQTRRLLGKNRPQTEKTVVFWQRRS